MREKVTSFCFLMPSLIFPLKKSVWFFHLFWKSCTLLALSLSLSSSKMACSWDGRVAAAAKIWLRVTAMPRTAQMKWIPLFFMTFLAGAVPLIRRRRRWNRRRLPLLGPFLPLLIWVLVSAFLACKLFFFSLLYCFFCLFVFVFLITQKSSSCFVV